MIDVGLVAVGSYISVIAAGIWLSALARRSERQRWAGRVGVWAAAARAAGLDDVRLTGTYRVANAVTARAGPHRVRIEGHYEDRSVAGTVVVVDSKCGLTLRPETVVSGIEKAVGPPELQIGDEAFDREVYVRGAPLVLRAVLDRDTRRLVRGLVRSDGAIGVPRGQVSIRDGEIRWTFAEQNAVFIERDIVRGMKVLVDAADRLACPATAEKLADNLAHDPEWRVRANIVALLAETFPNDPVTHTALVAACADERAEVQLAAARARGGEEGRATLVEIASRESCDDACASAAVRALRDDLPREPALAILGSALRTRRTQTARACLERLGRAGGREVVKPLAKVLALETGDQAVSAAAALGASQASEAEKPLVAALDHDDPQVRVAAAEALGRVGSPAAVLPLEEAAARHPQAHLRRVTRQAIAEIQSRLHGASPGQLSLAEGDAGALTLADDDASGRLSMAPPKDSK
jgi:HEAT repeat protein